MTRADVRTIVAAVAILSCARCAPPPTEPTRVIGLAVTSVSPASGPSSGGTSVTVNGHNFTPSLGVRFGAVPAASVVFINANQIVAVTPPHTAGVVEVSVNSGGSSTSLSNAFTFN